MNDDTLINNHRVARSSGKQEPKGRRWEESTENSYNNGNSSLSKPNNSLRKVGTRSGLCFCSLYRGLICSLVVLMFVYQYYEDIELKHLGNIEAYSVMTKEIIAEATSTFSDNGEKTAVARSELNDKPKALKTIRPITAKIKQEQLKNYRSGKGFLLNLHPTHHGGTSFCGIIGRTGGPVASKKFPEIAPNFACWFDRDKTLKTSYSPHNMTHFLATTPVGHNEMETYLKDMRSKFHMTSWEYDGVDEMQRNISETNWEHPDLVSVVITREPISRILAGGTYIKRWYPGYMTGELSHAGWWDYASNPKRQQTDNFFLRILEGTRRPGIPVGKNREYRRRLTNENSTQKSKTSVPRTYMYTDDNLPTLDALRGDFQIDENNYDKAVAILDRFTVVLDIACLDDGFDALARLLGLDMPSVTAKRTKANEARARKKKDARPSAEERIGHDDVYKYLLEKNKFDIKLYEYSKTISLVDCNS